MRIYSLNPISVHQEDKNTAFKAVAPAQGMFLDTPTRLSEVPIEKHQEMVSNMMKAEAEHQLQQEQLNNQYSHSFKVKKEEQIENKNPKEIVQQENLDVQEYHENGDASVMQAAGTDDSDFCYEMKIPNSNHSLYIYNKCMHKMQAGSAAAEPTVKRSSEMNQACYAGSINPDVSSDSVVIAGKSGNGIAFNENNGNGIAFNENHLDNLISTLDNSKGGAIPAIVGQLAMQLIPQIPAIISAIKQKRDDSKVGNGLIDNMRRYNTVRAVMNNLPAGKTASYYNDMIKEFNAFKRAATGISFNEGEGVYYASGKVTDGIKKFFGWVRDKYNQNKEVFKPIRDALVNAANNSLQAAVDSASKKANEYVKSKTDNKDIHRIVNAATDVGQAVTSELKDKINTIGNGIQPDRVYSVLN